jgi:GPH family glycoside/pentoside/hexuronide:cation symporter
MPERMSTPRRVAYGLGNAGFNLTDSLVVAVAVYFYLPPPGRELAAQVSDRVFLGFGTVFGLAMLVGRVFDMLADPVVGAASDRSRSRLGRRRAFLIWGCGPMIAIPVLLFFPPGPPGSAANALWLTALLSLYFVFFTIYVAPYLALIPELAWSQDERVRLSRILAVAAFPALSFGMFWPAGIDLGREIGLGPEAAIRWIAVLASLLALALCLAPILAVDEQRYARTAPADLSLRQALAATLRNRPFVLYLGAQLLFLFAINLLRPVAPYVATVVLGRSEGFAAWMSAGTFAGLVVGLWWMARAVGRLGAKRAMLGCLGLFSVAMASLGLLEADVPGGPHDARNLAVGFTAISILGAAIAGFMVLPHVFVSQLVDYDERRTGAQRAAMYFGVQGLVTKWMYGVGAWAFTFLLARFGNSPEEPLGVILVGPVAAAACLLAMGLYALYPEREILAEGSRPEDP